MTDIDTTPDATEDLPGELTLRARVLGHPWWLAIAALIFLALWLWREAMMLVARENAQSQQAEINRLVHENELLTQQVERMSGELSGLTSAHVKTIALTGTAGTGKIFLDTKEKRAIAYFYNLPPNKAYHLWMTAPNASAADAGTFSVGKSGRGSLEVQNAVEGATYVVTRGDANAEAFLKSGS